MFKVFQNNILYVIAGTCVLVSVILGVYGLPILALSVLGLAIGVGLSSNISYLFLLLILSTPLSVNFIAASGFRIGIPNEVLLPIILGVVVLKLISGMRLSLKFLHHPISITLFLDMGWSLYTALLSDEFTVSIKRFILKFLYLLIFFYFLPQFLKRFKKENWLFLLYTIGFIIPIISTTFNHLQLGIGYKTSLQVSQPFFDEHTIYAACATFLLPYLILNIWKNKTINWAYFIGAGFLGIAFVLSYSRAAWLSFLVALIIGVLLKVKTNLKQFGYLFGTGLVLLLIFFQPIYTSLERNNTKYDDEISSHFASVTNLQNDASNLERINRWICAYRMFEDHPITGTGPGTYQFIYHQYQHPQHMTQISTNHGDNGNAHSEYLMALSEMGLPGFLILLSWVYFSFTTGVKLYYSSKISTKHKNLALGILLGLLTFYVHGLFNSFIDSSKIAILIYGGLGILVSLHTDLKEEN